MSVVKARITFLEMSAPPVHRVQMPSGHKLALMATKNVPLSFYRYLYAEIGRPHHWQLQHNLSDDALAAVVHAATTEIQVLYRDGSPAGFFELDMAKRQGAAEIVYFGLMPHAQRMGLSKFFLSEAIFSAWGHAPARVTIQTNTLDSPRALQLYQRMGFSPVGWGEEDVEPWE